jgi:CheY-like chemotaxis protein
MLIQRLLTMLLNPQKGESTKPPHPILDICLEGPVHHFDSIQNAAGASWMNLQVPKPSKKKITKGFKTRKPQILLVEDNSLNQRITGHVLKKLGLTADVAQDGASGVDLVRKTNYDLILMDIHMPVMDGVEATRIIRSELRNREDIRIIGLTASSIQSDHDSFVKAGMDEVMIKPLKLESLQEKISEWFN